MGLWASFCLFVCVRFIKIFVNRFCSGSYVSLLGNPMMDMGHTDDVGRRVGMFMSILAIGALAGPPISGAISTATGGFKAVGYYAGSSSFQKILN